MIMFVSVGYSQNLQTNHITPNGVLDAIFDKQGNQYTFNDILINTDNNQAYNRVALLGCSTNSIFNLYFETGCGLDNITSQIDNDRRAVICQVFEDLSAFITTTNSALQPTSTTKVNIWVRNINNIPNISSNALGVASGFYSLPSSSTIGGIADNEIWKTIHAGTDSFANSVAPLSSFNVNGIFYHGFMAFNFNPTNASSGFTAYNWNVDTSVDANSSQYDLYTTVLHEMLHALGFNSLVNENGLSGLGNNYKYFSRYDLFLKNASNTSLLITNSTSPLYNLSFNTALNTTILRPGCTISGNVNNGNSINTTLCNDALKFNGSNGNVPVYTPTCFEKSSSLSHFEDEIYPTCSLPHGDDSYFVMSNANASGVTKRYVKPEERAALCDIGYSVNTSYGVSGAKIDGNNTFYNYQNTSLCNGIIVAGINDGKSPNNTFTYLVNSGSTISINASDILSNDRNASEFVGLEDITGNSNLYPNSGNSSTYINFNSSFPGVHLLRYIPKNGSQLGNITYIYVYVQPIITNTQSGTTSCNPNPNICDLVSNGNFEQNSAIPNTTGEFKKACGWWDDLTNGADYFHTSSPYMVNNVRIPCNSLGIQNQTNGGNAYAGFQARKNIVNTALNSYEIMKTNLSTPLNAGTQYQLSFNVSKAEGTSVNGIKIQAFLSADNIPTQPTGNLNITNGIFLENSVVSSNYNDSNWDNIVFNFTANGGEKYLYLGGLNNVQFSILPIVNSPINGCNFGNQNTPTNNYITSYYYVDNVSLVPTNGAEFNLPTNMVCGDPIISNLATFLNAVPTTGTFSGQGVSFNGSTYSFNPAISGTGTFAITYTYMSSSDCPISLIKNITVSTPSILPTFSAISPLCQGAAYVLPTTSNNGIEGTWSPLFNSFTTTTYTFTPNINSCAIPTTLTVPVNNSINAVIPTFNPISTICVGDLFTLPTISNNGYTGSWTPTIDNTQTTTYTFTPNNGQCAKRTTLTVEVNNASAIITGSNSVCRNSNETYTASISGGIWLSSDSNIADIDSSTGELIINQTGTFEVLYLLTVGSCSSMTSHAVTILDPDASPIFSFPTTICSGGIRPNLPFVSDDGIHGNWDPNTVDNSVTSNYTFYPDNNCTNPFTQTITVINGGDLITNADNFQIPYLSAITPSIFLNDTFNGALISSNFLGLEIFLNGSSALGISVNPDGTLNLPPDLPIGVYSIDYYLENDCLQSDIVRVDITIYDATITTDDKREVNLCYTPNAYTTTESIFDNVTFGDNVRADATTLDVSLTTEPPGFSINQDGTINIPANCMPGSYSYIYSFCPAGSTTGCVNDIKLQVVVATTIKANGDVFYFDIYGNKVPNTNSVYKILDNDRFYPECILPDVNNVESDIFVSGVGVNATFSLIDSSQLNNKFTISASGIINPTNGVVTPPSNNTIPEGTYPFSYTICDNRPGYTTICNTAYGWIGVIGYVNNRINNSIYEGSNALKSFIVSPNPSEGIFTIDFTTEITDTTIEVYSILGQKLYSEVISNNNSIDVDLQKFVSGTYTLKISDKEKSITKLIIKK